MAEMVLPLGSGPFEHLLGAELMQVMARITAEHKLIVAGSVAAERERRKIAEEQLLALELRLARKGGDAARQESALPPLSPLSPPPAGLKRALAPLGPMLPTLSGEEFKLPGRVRNNFQRTFTAESASSVASATEVSSEEGPAHEAASEVVLSLSIPPAAHGSSPSRESSPRPLLLPIGRVQPTPPTSPRPAMPQPPSTPPPLSPISTASGLSGISPTSGSPGMAGITSSERAAVSFADPEEGACTWMRQTSSDGARESPRLPGIALEEPPQAGVPSPRSQRRSRSVPCTAAGVAEAARRAAESPLFAKQRSSKETADLQAADAAMDKAGSEKPATSLGLRLDARKLSKQRVPGNRGRRKSEPLLPLGNLLLAPIVENAPQSADTARLEALKGGAALRLPPQNRKLSTISDRTIASMHSVASAASGMSLSKSFQGANVHANIGSMLRHSERVLSFGEVSLLGGAGPNHYESEGSVASRGTFDPLPDWIEDPRMLKRMSHMATVHQSQVSATSFVWTRSTFEDFSSGRCTDALEKMRHFVVHPNSRARIFWDLVVTLLVCYDLIKLPVQAFVTPTGFPEVVDWAGRVLWTFDILLSFWTGFVRVDGTVESRFKSIAQKYLRTWLVFDVVMVFLGWWEVVAEDIERIRLLALVRVFRLARVRKVLENLTYNFCSEKASLFLSIFNSVVAIVMVMHSMACCWIGLGRSRNSTNWIATRDLNSEDHGGQYVLAIHWTMTNFYGSMDLEPTNQTERIFAVAALFVGFLTATAFVAAFTSSMTRLHLLTRQQNQQLHILRKFLLDNNIPTRLAARVQLQAKHMLRARQASTQEQDVELLQILSEPVRIELQYEVYAPIVTKHPLFALLAQRAPAATRRLFHTGLRSMTLAEDDVLFQRGEVPTAPVMIFVRSGTLAYNGEGDEHETLGPGEWACEAVLWTNWIYHGTLRATSACRLVLLDAQMFRAFSNGFRVGGFDLPAYVRAFLEVVNESPDMRTELGSGMDVASLVHSTCGSEEEPPKTQPLSPPGFFRFRRPSFSAAVVPVVPVGSAATGSHSGASTPSGDRTVTPV